MAFAIINGVLILHHNTSAFGQSARGQLETEAIGAVITYLTQQSAE
jgi:hypothetical protein